jgi:hypothetical protein
MFRQESHIYLGPLEFNPLSRIAPYFIILLKQVLILLEQVVVRWSNARRCRQIPAYTEVMLRYSAVLHCALLLRTSVTYNFIHYTYRLKQNIIL